MRVVLFDWTAGGHRPIYVRRFVEALAPAAEVVVAVPDETAAELGDLPAELVSLGEPRPRLTGRVGRHSLLRREVDLFRYVSAGADHAVHLYADHALAQLAWARVGDVATSILIFYPRSHYPDAFRSRLSPRERATAVAKEWLVRRWRRRPDAESVLALDEEAVRRWQSTPGAPAHWLPEPPVLVPEGVAVEGARTGCVLYGALAPRKGLDRLARAVSLAPTKLTVTVAGRPDCGFTPRVDALAAEMRAAGATVEVVAREHSEAEGLGRLARARCVVLPYAQHTGMSRVLMEACAVGTPVVAHDWGLLGELVRRNGLGLAVDCADPAAFRSAILELTEDPESRRRHQDALAAFAARSTPEHFREALLAALRAPVSTDIGVPA